MDEDWPDPSIEWKDLWSDEWASGVVRLERQVTNVDVTYKGKCPRCDHKITVVVPRPVDDFLIAEDFFKEASSEPTPPSTTDGRSSCNCGKEHAKRPDDAEPQGCGAYAYIYFS